MRHSDTWKLVEKIRQIEIDQLVTALKAVGGCYSWYDDDKEEWIDESKEEEAPIILVCRDDYDSKPMNVKVRSVGLRGNNRIVIDAETTEYGDWVDINVNDVFGVGQLPFITDLIPEPEGYEYSLEAHYQIWTYDDIETLQEITNQVMEPFWAVCGGEIDHIEFLTTIREQWLPEFNKEYREKLDHSSDYTSDWLKATTEFCKKKLKEYFKENI